MRDGNVINLDLSKINDNQLIFENGDELYIETTKGIVTTIGAVQNASTFIWKKGHRAKYYIRNSGGKIKKDSDKSYLTLANGITKKIGFLRNPKVETNSFITINRKVEKEKKELFQNILLKSYTVVRSYFNVRRPEPVQFSLNFTHI